MTKIDSTTKIILLSGLLSILANIFFSCNVFAQPMSEYELPETPTSSLNQPERSAPPENSFIISLNQNARAPFEGVLYNMEANAWLISEMERINSLWRAEAITELNLLRAWSLRELERLHNVALHNEEALNLQITTLQEDTRSLRELNMNLTRQIGWTRGKKMVIVFTGVGSAIIGAAVGWLVGSFAP